jgi:8-oxo-dGTP diphosphatase
MRQVGDAGVRLAAMTARPPIVAAGAVVTRRTETGPEVLLVHRPKYDDWSFPKGKLDPGEHASAAAVREVAEETGVAIRLGPRLGSQQYVVSDGTRRTKVVHYWVGRVLPTEDGDVGTYQANDEIDRVAWVPVHRAAGDLTYEHDRETLHEAMAVRRHTVPLAVVRHGKAMARKDWDQDDRERPLTDEGRSHAELLVPVLAAYGVTRVVSSSSTRCWTTVAPYAEAADLEVEVSDALTQEDAQPDEVAAQVARLVAAKEPTALCSHRPVLPWILQALDVPPVALEPGDVLVAHLRKGRVVTVEHLRPSEVLPAAVVRA